MGLIVVERQNSFDQHFRDLLQSLRVPFEKLEKYHEPSSEVATKTKDGFEFTMDAKDFTPEEISVKIVGRNIIIEAKHEEKRDQDGSLTFRHYSRKCTLPEGCDAEQIASKLSSDGVLKITAPKLKPKSDDKERVVQITLTGPTKKSVTSN